MLNVALLSALSYFICYAGNWMFGQSMSDRPIFIGAVTGLLLGDLQQGLIIGATLEAVFMGSVNIGGQISADHSAATVFAVAFATNATLDPQAALTIAVPIGILMGFVTMFVNNIFLTVFTTLMDKWALEGNASGSWSGFADENDLDKGNRYLLSARLRYVYLYEAANHRDCSHRYCHRGSDSHA